MSSRTEQVFLVNSASNVTIPKLAAVPGTSAAPVNLENVQDFSTVCRTCATITECVIPIFEGDGLQNNLADKINKYLRIKVLENDELPRVVCYQCASTLLAWHELVKCSEQAETALKARLAQLKQLKESGQNDQNKTEQSFYEQVHSVLTEYLTYIGMDGEISDYVCQKCPGHAALTDIKSLAEHIRSNHLMTDPDCLENFIQDNITCEESLNWDNFDREASSEEETKQIEKVLPNFFCPFCESIFSTTTQLICHLNKHIEVCIDKGTTCCDIVYLDKKTFVDHLQEKHVKRPTKEVSNVCRSCGYQAADINDLQSHVNNNHNHKDKEENKKKLQASAKNQKFIPAVCPECNKTFSNKYNMFSHMKSYHQAKKSSQQEDKKKFECEQCGKSYSNQGNLAFHQKYSHGGVMDHVCSYCGEAFPTRKAREVHVRIHTGDKPFQCLHCEKCFRAKNSLDRHLDMHSDIRKYACDVCSKRFRKRTHLTYHLNTHRKK